MLEELKDKLVNLFLSSKIIHDVDLSSMERISMDYERTDVDRSMPENPILRTTSRSVGPTRVFAHFDEDFVGTVGGNVEQGMWSMQLADCFLGSREDTALWLDPKLPAGYVAPIPAKGSYFFVALLDTRYQFKASEDPNVSDPRIQIHSGGLKCAYTDNGMTTSAEYKIVPTTMFPVPCVEHYILILYDLTNLVSAINTALKYLEKLGETIPPVLENWNTLTKEQKIQIVLQFGSQLTRVLFTVIKLAIKQLCRLPECYILSIVPYYKVTSTELGFDLVSGYHSDKAISDAQVLINASTGDETFQALMEPYHIRAERLKPDLYAHAWKKFNLSFWNRSISADFNDRWSYKPISADKVFDEDDNMLFSLDSRRDFNYTLKITMKHRFK